MLTLAQLEDLVRGGESGSLELKATSGERRDAMHSVVAFLNTRGGQVVFGVRPDRRIVGQQVSDRTLEEIAEEFEHVDPPAWPQVERVPVRPGFDAITVTVPQGPNRPYSYKGQAWMRVANTSRKMSRDKANRMLIERFHGERRWETELLEDWKVDDLHLAELTRTLDEAIRRGRMNDPGSRDPMELLRGFGVVRDGLLLRAAALLFGKRSRVEAELPQCLLRLAKFKGADKTEFLDNRQFHGNTFDLLSKAESFLRDNLPIAGRVVPDLFERIDDPLYPPVALREALANAICHRDYSIGGGSVAVAVYQDRLEITSSGPLHYGLSAEDLFKPHESLPWNPLVARVFHRRGIIESWGRGTLKMAELTDKAGLPRPEIEEAGGGVVVRFFPSDYIPPRQVNHDLTLRQQQILKVLDKRGQLAVRDVASDLGLDSRPIRDDLGLLKQLGLVANRGHGRGSVWFLVR